MMQMYKRAALLVLMLISSRILSMEDVTEEALSFVVEVSERQQPPAPPTSPIARFAWVLWPRTCPAKQLRVGDDAVALSEPMMPQLMSQPRVAAHDVDLECGGQVLPIASAGVADH